MYDLNIKKYIDKLVNYQIVSEYNDTYDNIIKIKIIDVTSSTYIEFGIENNEKDPTFEIGNYVTISKFENNFAKCYAPSWSEKDFVIKKLKILFLGNM